MKRPHWFFIVLTVYLFTVPAAAQNEIRESSAEKSVRMQWWREARFGMFIHWGLYSLPAGEWKGKTDYGEWIRNNAHIPVAEYEKFVPQFNPGKFDADEWVRMAKNAGMKYIVITSKHHDGFCMFDTKQTDFDIMATPFHRDPLKELADACRREGLKMCFYHSIMDWHHPDYLPRRDWEKNERPEDGADFNRFKTYLKAELKELLTNYGDIGLVWFDGNWESTWSNEQGKELYEYVRSLQPNIIVNNRVGQPPPSESGVGFTNVGIIGDYGTPEQEIPATGIPDMDWETCMTMNDHWGYNKNDVNFKPSRELLRNLADIASKGGNFLLNVGPTAEGTFPQQSIDRLRDMSAWMKVNGEAIYKTEASPFQKLRWGRATSKRIDGGTRLYLHVFDWPTDGNLVVPGISNRARAAYLLSDENHRPISFSRIEDALVLKLPAQAPDSINSVVVLDVDGPPDVSNPPVISAKYTIFLDSVEVTIAPENQKDEIHYTLDGSVPTATVPVSHGTILLTATASVTARPFRNGKPVGDTASAKFEKVTPRPASTLKSLPPGLLYNYMSFSEDVQIMPDFWNLTPDTMGLARTLDLSIKRQKEHFGIEYNGFVTIPTDGLYTFYISSDDGSKLFIDDKLLVNNDLLHGMVEKAGVVALAKGYHKIVVQYFQNTGDLGLVVSYEGPGVPKQELPASILSH